jgi:phage-related minor tail protein
MNASNVRFQESLSASNIYMGSALGNVFNRGRIVPFAYGGIINYPTMFPMSGGQTGLMGENGPEAVMPLRRTRRGKLGVESAGDSNIEVVVNVVNESGRPMEAKQGGTRFNGKQLITEVMLNDIHGYGPIRNAIQGIK